MVRHYFRTAVAIFVGHPKPPAVDGLRHCSGSIAGSHGPAAFVFLKSMPLLPTADRRAALPAPDDLRPELKRFLSRPRQLNQAGSNLVQLAEDQ